MLQFKAFKFVSIIVQRWKATTDELFFSPIIQTIFCFLSAVILILHSTIKKSNQEATSPSSQSIILDWLKNIPIFKQLSVIRIFRTMLIVFLSFVYIKTQIKTIASKLTTIKNLNNATSNLKKLTRNIIQQAIIRISFNRILI